MSKHRRYSDPGPRIQKILTKNDKPIIGLSERKLPNPKFGQDIFNDEWDWTELIESLNDCRLRRLGLFSRTESPLFIDIFDNKENII